MGGGTADQPGPGGPISITPSPADYESGKIAPGTYEIDIEGCLDNSNCSIKDTTTVILTVLDPCDPPSEIIAPSL